MSMPTDPAFLMALTFHELAYREGVAAEDIYIVVPDESTEYQLAVSYYNIQAIQCGVPLAHDDLLADWNDAIEWWNQASVEARASLFSACMSAIPFEGAQEILRLLRVQITAQNKATPRTRQKLREIMLRDVHFLPPLVTGLSADIDAPREVRIAGGDLARLYWLIAAGEKKPEVLAPFVNATGPEHPAFLDALAILKRAKLITLDRRTGTWETT